MINEKEFIRCFKGFSTNSTYILKYNNAFKWGEVIKINMDDLYNSSRRDYQLVTLDAEIADIMYFRGKQKRRYLNEVDFIDKLIKIRKCGKKIIDAGCGGGVHMHLLGQKGYEIKSFDVRREMVEIAKKRNPRLDIVVGDMRNFPLDDIVDVIICMYGAINYLQTEKDFLVTLRNFHIHLQREGMAIIDTRYYDNLPDNIKIWSTNKYTLVKRWIRGKNRIGLYRVFYTYPAKGVMVMEDHRQYFQDPFWIADKLKKAGFSSTKIFDNYNLQKRFTKKSTGYKPVVVGFK